jgi:hypothetical protein
MRADAGGTTAPDGAVGLESDSEHPTERDAIRLRADR